MYQAKILADSLAPNRKRLTTFEITYPRFVHAELMTHRMFSRNSASSRAIPIHKMIERVIHDPAMPVHWGKNQSGMQAREELNDFEKGVAVENWLEARDHAVMAARAMHNGGVHKQIANRLLEPWMWITVIVSATEYANFFHLRCHPDAQPELRLIAEMMRELYNQNTPEEFEPGIWHLPLIEVADWHEIALRYPHDFNTQQKTGIKVSVGRCARVSYLTHDGVRDLQADIDLHDRLATSGHWSPFEHVATPLPKADEVCGNFIGWRQYRKDFARENIK